MTASTNGSAEPLQGFHAGLTIGQAASALGVSPSTVRRWVRSGRLLSDQVAVGDGFEYRIPMGGLEAVKGSANPCMDPTVNGSMDASRPPILDVPIERSAALAAYNAQLVAPLTAVIERRHETIVSQAEKLESQAKTIGRQGAELERATSAIVALGDELAAADRTRQRDVRRHWIALAAAATLAVAAGTLAATGAGFIP